MTGLNMNSSFSPTNLDNIDWLFFLPASGIAVDSRSFCDRVWFIDEFFS